jgi:hypothetical protein
MAMNPNEPARMDRRDAIKWMLAAGAGAMLANVPRLGAGPAPGAPASPRAGYGTDPDLVRAYKAGELWPLTFSDPQRRQVAALCDVIIPADGGSPSASSVGVTDFIDEWVSAPYPAHAADARVVLAGLADLEAESKRRFGALFADATPEQRQDLCGELAAPARAGAGPEGPRAFFAKFRELTMSGFYTTPAGRQDLGYVGNVPLARFDGPPAELIDRLGLRDEVEW